MGVSPERVCRKLGKRNPVSTLPLVVLLLLHFGWQRHSSILFTFSIVAPSWRTRKASRRLIVVFTPRGRRKLTSANVLAKKEHTTAKRETPSPHKSPPNDTRATQETCFDARDAERPSSVAEVALDWRRRPPSIPQDVDCLVEHRNSLSPRWVLLD